MTAQHPSPPFDTWLWMQAWSETWCAGLDPAGAGQRLHGQRLSRLIDATLRGSPFYRRRHPDARELADFRPVSKAELMAHFDDWATDRRINRAAAQAFVADPQCIADAWLGDYLLWTSSGTSGEPGVFVQDARSLAAYDAIDALRLRGAGPGQASLGSWGARQRFAFVGATGGHFAGLVSMERLRRLVPAALAPEIRVLSVLEPLRDVAQALQALQPSVLITYPSCAAALAQLQQRPEGSAQLRLTLKEVWMGGEQLSAEQREQIQAAFGCPVRNNYGASEFFTIAWECAHGELHLNDDWLVLEPVDEQLQPLPMGEMSHSTLLTNLANLTQPLLRYQLGDRVRRVAERCSCGSAFPLIEVQGRADDTLRLRDAQHRPVTILPLALETAIEEGAHVTQFQALCGSNGDSIELRFEASVGDARAAFMQSRRALAAFLAHHGVSGTRISMSAAEPLRQRASGKLRRVVVLPAAPVRRKPPARAPTRR
ncbi:phenylacetate--CoA ligase family protein [Methylibium sp.]|uniref:phenylacetate--CoA ligase family protein n=1 Tax=Methylibium sp. TaxID=2067992 RepID=UPI003BAC2067